MIGLPQRMDFFLTLSRCNRGTGGSLAEKPQISPPSGEFEGERDTCDIFRKWWVILPPVATCCRRPGPIKIYRDEVTECVTWFGRDPVSLWGSRTPHSLYSIRAATEMCARGRFETVWNVALTTDISRTCKRLGERPARANLKLIRGARVKAHHAPRESFDLHQIAWNLPRLRRKRQSTRCCEATNLSIGKIKSASISQKICMTN